MAIENYGKFVNDTYIEELLKHLSNFTESDINEISNYLDKAEECCNIVVNILYGDTADLYAKISGTSYSWGKKYYNNFFTFKLNGQRIFASTINKQVGDTNNIAYSEIKKNVIKAQYYLTLIQEKITGEEVYVDVDLQIDNGKYMGKHLVIPKKELLNFKTNNINLLKLSKKGLEIDAVTTYLDKLSNQSKKQYLQDSNERVSDFINKGIIKEGHPQGSAAFSAAYVHSIYASLISFTSWPSKEHVGPFWQRYEELIKNEQKEYYVNYKRGDAYTNVEAKFGASGTNPLSKFTTIIGQCQYLKRQLNNRKKFGINSYNIKNLTKLYFTTEEFEDIKEYIKNNKVAPFIQQCFKENSFNKL